MIPNMKGLSRTSVTIFLVVFVIAVVFLIMLLTINSWYETLPWSQ